MWQIIYFIARPDRSAIKIGTTIRLSQRLKQLAAEHGEGLEVLAVVDGSHAEERGLHRRFGHLRRVGEWFEPGDDLMGFIVSDGKPWDCSDEDDVTVKIDRKLASMAKVIAGRRGISSAELLSEALRGPLDRAYAQLVKELGSEASKGPAE